MGLSRDQGRAPNGGVARREKRARGRRGGGGAQFVPPWQNPRRPWPSDRVRAPADGVDRDAWGGRRVRAGWGLRDWIRETNSDIRVYFRFPPQEMDRIRMEIDWDISDIHFTIFLPFPSVLRRQQHDKTIGRNSANLTKNFVAEFVLSRMECLRLCLDSKKIWQKTSHHAFGHMHEVLNDVYL